MMRQLLLTILGLASLSAFSAELPIFYTVAGFGEAPDSIQINDQEAFITPQDCLYPEEGKYRCEGEMSVGSEINQGLVELKSEGTKTLDMHVQIFEKCTDGKMVKLTNASGLYSVRAISEMNLLLTGTIPLNACQKFL